MNELFCSKSLHCSITPVYSSCYCQRYLFEEKFYHVQLTYLFFFFFLGGGGYEVIFLYSAVGLFSFIICT